jgi:hypothetical protein
MSFYTNHKAITIGFVSRSSNWLAFMLACLLLLLGSIPLNITTSVYLQTDKFGMLYVCWFAHIHIANM